MNKIKVTIELEFKGDADDDEAIKEAIASLLEEQIADDSLSYTVEVEDEDDEM